MKKPNFGDQIQIGKVVDRKFWVKEVVLKINYLFFQVTLTMFYQFTRFLLCIFLYHCD